MLRRLRIWWHYQKNQPDILLPDIWGGPELSAEAIEALNKLADKARTEMNDPKTMRRYGLQQPTEHEQIMNLLDTVFQEDDDIGSPKEKGF